MTWHGVAHFAVNWLALMLMYWLGMWRGRRQGHTAGVLEACARMREVLEETRSQQ